jgi:TPR repeat protein
MRPDAGIVRAQIPMVNPGRRRAGQEGSRTLTTGQHVELQERRIMRQFAVQSIIALVLFSSGLPPVAAQTAATAVPTIMKQRLEQLPRMLDAARAGNQADMWDAKTEIEELPYPSRGDRRGARRLNASALDKFKKGQVAESFADFEAAFKADPSDQEISNNYGYVLYRAQRLADAERLLRHTLALAPARVAAWANLGEVFGAQQRTELSAASFMLAYRFSRNPERTREYVEKLIASDDTPGIKGAAQIALERLGLTKAGTPGATPAGTAAAPLAVGNTAQERRLQGANEGKTNVAQEGSPSRASSVGNVSVAAPTTAEVTQLLKAAQNGSADARNKLLDMANAGVARAQNAVGFIYDFGYSVEPNAELATVWYRKAAQQGWSMAQFNLGWNLYYGHGVQKNYVEAAGWLQRAAEQGNPYAMNFLGVLYERGQGVNADQEQAVKWFMRAAETGDARGNHNAGLCHESGRGVSADAKRAFVYYQTAASKGFAQSELKLAQSYEYGRGIGQDRVLAIDWYRRAARQGLESAKDALKRLGVDD